MEQALLFVAFMGAQASMNPVYGSAAQGASTAYFKQSGMEQAVDRYGRKLVPDPELRAYIGNAALVAKAVHDQRITYEWRF